MDSTVLLYHLLAEGVKVMALSVNYGQRHSKELDAACAIAKAAGVVHKVVDLSGISTLLTGSALISPEIAVPLGHYEDETMKLTVVPNRNMILLSLATAWAISSKSEAVVYAAHGGDHAIYPDCRIAFTEALAHAITLCDWHSIKLLTPFVSWTKGDVARRGYDLSVPLDLTWSCYNGGEFHCGRCGTCVERQEAFELASIPDPTIYESPIE